MPYAFYRAILCELESYKGVFYITCAIKMSENRLTTSTTGFILLTDILPELSLLYIYQDAFVILIIQLLM